MKHKATAIRKLFISILSTLLLAMSLTTSTYAWFQINSTGTVSGFDFTAISGLGFKVSIDDKVYTNDLSSDQIKMAILNSYNPDVYRLVTKEEDGKLEQYIETDVEEYINNQPVTKAVKLTSTQVSSEIKKKIALLPLTSKDGRVLYDLYNSESKTDNGRFLQFSVYFKAENEKKEDNQAIDIYLSGADRTEIDGTSVGKTELKSDSGFVGLLTKMTTNDKTYTKGESIVVSSLNAIRYSVEDTQYNLDVDKENEALMEKYNQDVAADPSGTHTVPELKTYKNATIYEPTDSYDLGSYATDYSGDDAQLKRLYDAKTSASFTYYNALKPFSQLDPLKYENKPETIRSLVDENGKDREDLPTVTTVKSGDGSRLVTFRFWLEGWDADCFDGLANSINVKLSFRSKYRLLNDNE